MAITFPSSALDLPLVLRFDAAFSPDDLDAADTEGAVSLPPVIVQYHPGNSASPAAAESVPLSRGGNVQADSVDAFPIPIREGDDLSGDFLRAKDISASLGAGNAGYLGPILVKGGLATNPFATTAFDRHALLDASDGFFSAALRSYRFYGSDRSEEDLREAVLSTLSRDREEAASSRLGALVPLMQHEGRTEADPDFAGALVVLAAARREENHVSQSGPVTGARLAANGSGGLGQGSGLSAPGGLVAALPEIQVDPWGRVSLVTLLEPPGPANATPADRAELPPPRGSDLLAAFLPLDRVSLERAADEFVAGLRDLGAELTLTERPGQGASHALGWLALIGSMELGRRWLKRRSMERAEAASPRKRAQRQSAQIPGWPGSWSTRVV